MIAIRVFWVVLTALLCAPILFLSGAEAVAARTEKAGNVILNIPGGWRRGERDGAVTFLLPGKLGILSVEPGEDVSGSFDAWFSAAWADFTRRHGGLKTSPGQINPPQGTEARIMGASMEDGRGGFLYVIYFAARKGTRVQPIVFLTTEARHQQESSAELMQVLSTLKFLPPKQQPRPIVKRWRTASILAAGLSDPAAARANPPAAGPAPVTPGKSIPGALEGTYSGIKMGAYGNTQIHLTFFPDGTVVRGRVCVGADGFDTRRAERELPSTMVGRYAVSGDRVRIVWVDGNRTEAELRARGGLTLYGRHYYSRPKVSGLVLNGAYARPGGGSGAIQFQGDGRFMDQGILRDTELAQNARWIAPHGPGRYRVRNNTLYLDYDNGQHEKVSIDFFEHQFKPPYPRVELCGLPFDRM